MYKPICILIFFFISCQQLKNENIISSYTGRYWDVVSQRDIRYLNPSYSFYFGSKGECYYYYYRIEEGKLQRHLFDYGDVIYPNTWKISGDTFTIQGFEYVIRKITSKKIELLPLGNPQDSMILKAVE